MKIIKKVLLETLLSSKAAESAEQNSLDILALLVYKACTTSLRRLIRFFSNQSDGSFALKSVHRT